MEWKYEKNRIYSIDNEGNVVSEVTYNEKNVGQININHVYVRPDKRGVGVASDTMELVANYIREKKLKSTATCSYAITWFKRNKDKYADIISDELFNEPIACSIRGKH